MASLATGSWLRLPLRLPPDARPARDGGPFGRWLGGRDGRRVGFMDAADREHDARADPDAGGRLAGQVPAAPPDGQPPVPSADGQPPAPSTVQQPLQQPMPRGVTPSMEHYALPAEHVVVPQVVDLVRERPPYDPREIVAAYEAHQRELYGYVLGMTRSAEIAEDVVQEAFLRLIRERNEGRAPANIRAWLYRVCANIAISKARRRGVAERYLPFLVRREVVEGPEREYLRRDDQRHLAEALAGLSPEERTALVLASRGFSGAEIAAAIGRSPSATRTLMCRARVRLRGRLEREVVTT